jgi:hypothetical protein
MSNTPLQWPNYRYDVGLNNAGSYQVSGIPFVSGGINAAASAEPFKLSFPTVTRWIYVSNHDPARVLKMGFSENGVQGTNYFRIPPPYTGSAVAGAPSDGGMVAGLGVRLEVKVQELWFTGSTSFDVMVGLTNIDGDRINNISPSGSNWSGSMDGLYGRSGSFGGVG